MAFCLVRPFFGVLIAVFVAGFILPGVATAQQLTINKNGSGPEFSNTAPTKNEDAPTGHHSKKISWMSSNELILSVSVLLFGVFVISQQSFVIRKSQFEANDIIKIYGLSFIILATLFIITAGYGSEQIAPAMGLFGTIAGYILGRNTKTGGK